MHISFALGWSLSCASAVLAGAVHAPPGPLSPRGQYDSDASAKAGAILSKGNNSIQYVTSSFVVPTFMDVPGSGAAFWVGIDGGQCNVSLRTGVDLYVNDLGSINYTAWYQWYPSSAKAYNMTSIDIGDKIELAVTAETTTSGSAAIIISKNANSTMSGSGDYYSEEVSSDDYPLCLQDAQWMVSPLDQYAPQNYLPLVDFGYVAFKYCGASGFGRAYSPADGGTVVNIVQNGRTATTASIEGSFVTVDYVRV